MSWCGWWCCCGCSSSSLVLLRLPFLLVCAAAGAVGGVAATAFPPFWCCCCSCLWLLTVLPSPSQVEESLLLAWQRIGALGVSVFCSFFTVLWSPLLLLHLLRNELLLAAKRRESEGPAQERELHPNQTESPPCSGKKSAAGMDCWATSVVHWLSAIVLLHSLAEIP